MGVAFVAVGGVAVATFADAALRVSWRLVMKVFAVSGEVTS